MISALNAFQHGLTSETPVLPTEAPNQYDEFRDQLTRDLEPKGAIEERLVGGDRSILTWRLRRASSLEFGVLAGGVAARDERFFRDLQRKQEITEGDVQSARFGPSPDQIVEILNEDGHDILSVRIADAQEVQRCEEARLGSAFIEDAAGPNALGKLSRYETALFRRRNQALETLSKLQAQRNEASPGDAE